MSKLQLRMLVRLSLKRRPNCGSKACRVILRNLVQCSHLFCTAPSLLVYAAPHVEDVWGATRRRQSREILAGSGRSLFNHVVSKSLLELGFQNRRMVMVVDGGRHVHNGLSSGSRTLRQPDASHSALTALSTAATSRWCISGS